MLHKEVNCGTMGKILDLRKGEVITFNFKDKQDKIFEIVLKCVALVEVH
jgi:hypothetical protein